MNTTTITFSIESSVKEKAKKKAEKEGIDFQNYFSSLLNKLLKEFVKKESLATDFHVRLEEEPSEYFKQQIKKAREDRKKGKVSPIFDNAEDAIKWLNS